MSEKIVVPVLGESITEATVAKWLKNAGDAVEADEPIVELETDKVNLEVPSPVKGILTEINSKDGSVVEVGALLGSVSENGSGGSFKKEERTNLKEIPSEKKNCLMVMVIAASLPMVRRTGDKKATGQGRQTIQNAAFYSEKNGGLSFQKVVRLKNDVLFLKMVVLS